MGYIRRCALPKTSKSVLGGHQEQESASAQHGYLADQQTKLIGWGAMGWAGGAGGRALAVNVILWPPSSRSPANPNAPPTQHALRHRPLARGVRCIWKRVRFGYRAAQQTPGAIASSCSRAVQETADPPAKATRRVTPALSTLNPAL